MTIAGRPDRSPFIRVMKARDAKVKLDRKVPYELDGGTRKTVKKYRLKAEPRAITLLVPRPSSQNGGRSA